MQKSSDGSNSFDEAMAGNPRTPEPVVGDADNVQKTTYVVGRGTDPDAPDPTTARRDDGDGPVAARVQAGSGPNVLLWLVIAAVLAIALFYIF